MQTFLNDPKICVKRSEEFTLKERDTQYCGDIKSKNDARHRLKLANKTMDELQQKLYATDNHSILIIFQAMDAAGKDSTIRAVFSGLNPTGFQVSSFKSPSKLELDHDYLWRTQQALPERGRIGIFNRSHYEEVLVCRVHPEYILSQNIPRVNSMQDINADLWSSRFEQINNWEKHLYQNGTMILKFFLNVSKEEQKRRFMSRIEVAKKNWKFSLGDLKERAYWNDYMHAYQEAIAATAKPHAPWFVIPADDKIMMRTMVAEIVCQAMEDLQLSYPQMHEKAKEELLEGKAMLEKEN